MDITLFRADTGDSPAALFHSTDARVQLRLPVALAGSYSTIRVTTQAEPETARYTPRQPASECTICHDYE